MPESSERESEHIRSDYWRDTSFQECAEKLHIPREYWTNARVSQFVDVLNRAQNLQGRASTSVGDERVPPALDASPPLQDRLRMADVMMRAVVDVLKGDVGPNAATSPGYIKDKLNLALRRVGLEVFEMEQTGDSISDAERRRQAQAVLEPSEEPKP